MTKVRIVAAVVDTKQLVLYREDGKKIEIPQGDPRVRPLLDEITPIINAGLTAEVDLAAAPDANVYREFEEQSSGLVRFFRVAKKKVASFFGASPVETTPVDDEPVEPTVIGQVPEKLSDAIEDIMANAVPASSETFQQTVPDETVVAVVGKGKNARVVPGMENLKDQFAYALKLGSIIGVQRFIERISAVIDQRQHSVHDLLRFMERGDLPIADDGSIIIYKVLRRKPSAAKGVYVDCFTGRVTQQVGSYVCMDPKLVDHNRRNQCSNGLHVARRGYIRSFPGDVCVLSKVAPEDVIAVPNYDANKMRVCGYHILFELAADDYERLRDNKPMTANMGAQKLLGRAIAGDHGRPTEEVRIGGHHGTDVVITPLEADGSRKKIKSEPAKALDDPETAPPVDPRQVADTVAETRKAKAPAPAKPVASPRQQTARELYEANKFSELHTFKKNARVSWAVLGFSVEEQNVILEKITPAAASAQPVNQEKILPGGGLVGTPTPAPKPAKSYPATRAGEARKLFDEGRFVDLHNFKRQSKKSWKALGFTQAEERKIDVNRNVQPTPPLAVATPAKKAKGLAANLEQLPEPNGNRREIAQTYFLRKDWAGLLSHKKKVKLGWQALGFTALEETEILQNIPK